MTRTMIILGAAVLVAALVLSHLANLVTSSSLAQKTATPSTAAGATMVRVQAVERTISVEAGKPIAAGLPPWTKRLATLRTPPSPEGTAVPVVPDYSKSVR